MLQIFNTSERFNSEENIWMSLYDLTVFDAASKITKIKERHTCQ